MSDNVPIGNASQLVNDDVERDVNMQRIPPVSHKESSVITRAADIITAGHLVFLLDSTAFLTISGLVATDTEVAAGGYTAVVNADISGKIPADMDIARIGGILFKGAVQCTIHSGKQKAGALVSGQVYFAHQYDTTPNVHDTVVGLVHELDADSAQNSQFSKVSQCSAPVFIVNGIPYVTARMYARWEGMDTGNDTYTVVFEGYIQGLYLK